jgi:hypothetical protein
MNSQYDRVEVLTRGPPHAGISDHDLLFSVVPDEPESVLKAASHKPRTTDSGEWREHGAITKAFYYYYMVCSAMSGP